jgi:hypothetical protein
MKIFFMVVAILSLLVLPSFAGGPADKVTGSAEIFIGEGPEAVWVGETYRFHVNAREAKGTRPAKGIATLEWTFNDMDYFAEVDLQCVQIFDTSGKFAGLIVAGNHDEYPEGYWIQFQVSKNTYEEVKVGWKVIDPSDQTNFDNGCIYSFSTYAEIVQGNIKIHWHGDESCPICGGVETHVPPCTG